MQMGDLILVSVDDHVVEPPDLFDGFIAAKYADEAPRVVSDEISDKWIFGEGEARNAGLNAVAGRIPEEYGFEPSRFTEMRKGCFDVHERIKDMDANGVLGSLNFPSMARFAGQFFASRVEQDPDLALAVLQAYNDWHIEAWCDAYPGRFIPCTLVPIWDPQLMVDEVHRTVAKGSHSVSFSTNPAALGFGLPALHDEHWDPFWAACAETQTVVTMHIGSGAGPGDRANTAPSPTIAAGITCAGIGTFNVASNLVWSPIFQKHRDLRIALSEGGIGWIPYFLERADYTYEHHKAWTRPELGGRLPSEIFNEHIITCFIADDVGLENLRHLNEDMVTWECDYPHSDSPWPTAPEVVWQGVERLSDEQIDKVTHVNAMREFSFDAFSVIPREQCTVGALRRNAVGHDISLRSYGPPREDALAGVS
jgi:predicted TIM-barrel fold metal-dependent hydrolase